MEDSILLKISLITCCIGMTALYLVFIFMEETIVDIPNLKEIDDNTEVSVYAMIEKVIENDKVVQIEMMQTVKADAVIFKESNNSVGLSEGDVIKARGNMYQGKLVIQKYDIVR
ncbi:hypothetical protein H6503_00120 [Candidatus Woesearchaeota archaeon]|nr:hypothetical protein [Candidatus Woesearchaeota archaeon]